MAYDLNHLTTTEQLKAVATRMKEGLDGTLKSLAVTGNTVNFYTSDDASGTAAYSVDFPKDLFLDQTQTKFEGSFKFTAEKYPGAINPSLDDKPVFVLAVKGTTDAANGTESDTITYSFVDMSKLIDTYKAKAGDSTKILNISGYEIEVKIAPGEDNAIAVTDDGLKVNISGKTDKVNNATVNNLPALDVNGNLMDSGIAKTSVLLTDKIATNAEVTEMLNEVFGTPASNG